MSTDPILAGIEIPAALPLRAIETPAEVTHVEGCDCGGLDLHCTDCTIFSVDPDEARAAVDRAHRRVVAFSAALNAQLATLRTV